MLGVFAVAVLGVLTTLGIVNLLPLVLPLTRGA